MIETAGRIRAHVIPYWPANPYQPLLAEGLQRAGVDVETSASLARLAEAPMSNGEVVHLHWLPVAGPGPRQLLRWSLFARRIATLRRRGMPIVWTAHNVVPHESTFPMLDTWMSRTIARYATRIICHSSSARSALIAQLRIADASRIRIIPHGHYIDSYPNALARDDCRSRLGLPGSAMVFLLFGTLRAYKGTMELVDAFRRMREPDIRLLIVGKPRDAHVDADVRKQIDGDPRVTYVPGRVADADVQLYLNAADAVVFPYQKSLTSGALILAMSFGRTCIAPRLPGMADCVGDGGGILYDPDDRHGLSSALSVASQQRARLTEMGAGNLQRARTWDWASIAAATKRCYGEAIDAIRRVDVRAHARPDPVEGL